MVGDQNVRVDSHIPHIQYKLQVLVLEARLIFEFNPPCVSLPMKLAAGDSVLSSLILGFRNAAVFEKLFQLPFQRHIVLGGYIEKQMFHCGFHGVYKKLVRYSDSTSSYR